MMAPPKESSQPSQPGHSGGQPSQAEGQEVLIVDGDERVRKGLESLLASAGLAPTAVADPEYAVTLAREKHFAVVLVDIDTPRPEEGLEWMKKIVANSPASVALVMSARRTFEVAVGAFRAGANDVIIKAPDQVPYLQQRVIEVAAMRRRTTETTRLVEEAAALHEDMMQLLITQYCKATELAERASGHAESQGEGEMRILVVDHDTWLQRELGRMLQAKGGYALLGAASGGEALDRVGRERFHIVLVRDNLGDLPGSMVVRAIKGQSNETLSLVYTHPTSQQPGSVMVAEVSKVIPFIPKFTEPTQILERLDELREAFLGTQRERRYLAAFRAQHFDLLKRFAEMRQKLQRGKG
ncbi:MAG TPA: response regulator [Polyangia bacterium]|jgi:DNA-binding NtrC family response regulator|nr:response regulator [Polyangia bacterium]